MKKLFILSALIALMTTSANAEIIKASVNGMVCSFCATGIEKTFKAQPSVSDVKVDLETKLVTINTKLDQKLDDVTVKKLIGDAGYSVTNITREK